MHHVANAVANSSKHELTLFWGELWRLEGWGAAEKHGHVVVKVDNAATAGELVAHFEQANKSNLATSHLKG